MPLNQDYNESFQPVDAGGDLAALAKWTAEEVHFAVYNKGDSVDEVAKIIHAVILSAVSASGSGQFQRLSNPEIVHEMDS